MEQKGAINCNGYKLNKTHIHPWIDENLDSLMELEVSKLGMTKQDFVAVCIAEKLGISLNDDFMMDETIYTEIRIQEMEKEIKELENKKNCLEKRIMSEKNGEFVFKTVTQAGKH